MKHDPVVALEIGTRKVRVMIGEVDAQVIFELGLFEGVIACLPTLLAVYFYGKYRIDKVRHREILDQLAAQRA